MTPTPTTSGEADLPEALTEYLEAQDALDNREYAGINAEPYEKLVRSRNHARAALESALAAGQAKAAQSGLTDAYVGAREDLSIWKRRALEAEATVRNFVREANSPTFMGDPASDECHHGDAYIVNDCLRCGAPVCCGKCCAAEATPHGQVPVVQGDALSDAVRVPLDSLHADAAYLIGRLREGSMPYARVIEIIRERIDAAKAAIRARATHGQAPAKTGNSVSAQADSVQEDAARYRWLRRWKGQEHEPPFTVQHEIDGALWGGDLDAAIDADRKQGTNHD